MLKHKELLNTVITLTQVNGYFTKVLNENISKFGLNLTDFSVLDLLFQKGEQTTQKIGEKMLITSGSITYIVNKLEKMGLICRNKSETDKRITYIKLTKKGRETIFELLPLQIEKINEIFSDFSREDLINLNHLLKKFNFSFQI
jgi:transcriptional regulator